MERLSEQLRVQRRGTRDIANTMRSLYAVNVCASLVDVQVATVRDVIMLGRSS